MGVVTLAGVLFVFRPLAEGDTVSTAWPQPACRRTPEARTEFYEYESRKKTSDVVSEIVSEVEFTFRVPARFQSRNERFEIDLAFSISHL